MNTTLLYLIGNSLSADRLDFINHVLSFTPPCGAVAGSAECINRARALCHGEVVLEINTLESLVAKYLPIAEYLNAPVVIVSTELSNAVRVQKDGKREEICPC